MILAVAALPATANAAFELVDELADDQVSETITVEIDGEPAGTFALDARKRTATLPLRLTAPVHRYRLSGETLLDGERYAIEGAGLIVSPARLDEIAERAATAADAVVAYEAFVRELVAASPTADLAGVTLRRDPKSTAAAVAAAESRLKIDLPAAYERFVVKSGAFRFADPDLGRDGVLPPEDLATASEFTVRAAQANGWDDAEDLRKLRARIEKRFARAKRDVVLGTFELGEPLVLMPAAKCDGDERGIALPGSDFELLAVDAGDNPFLRLIDYDDDIMGEAECQGFDRLVAYSLHDHLIEMGDDALFLRDADEETIGLYRERVDAESRRIWLRLTSAD